MQSPGRGTLSECALATASWHTTVNQELVEAGSLPKPRDEAKHKGFLSERKENRSCKEKQNKNSSRVHFAMKKPAVGEQNPLFRVSHLQRSRKCILPSAVLAPGHRSVLTKGSHLCCGQLGQTGLATTSPERLVRTRCWWVQSLFSEVHQHGNIVRTEPSGGQVLLHFLILVTMQTGYAPRKPLVFAKTIRKLT